MSTDIDTAVTVHPAWLPEAALAPLRARTVAVPGEHPCLATVRAELAGSRPAPAATATLVVAALTDLTDPAEVGLPRLPDVPAHGYALVDAADRTVVLGADGPAALHGFYALVRRTAVARLTGEQPRDGSTVSAPAAELRMLDHWDNVAVHPVMGQVERGYSGGSIFYADGEVRADLSRVRAYARLLAVTGVAQVGINNVNVHDREARLLTDGLPDVARIAAELRPYGIRVALSVSFASPRLLGGLPTADPLDPDVVAWWSAAADRAYAAVPDLLGFLVKADSEGQPGPFAYGRSHADGANLLAAALRPHGGTVLWRAFVYDHHQDWRDRRTDRARAAYDHFAPLDGEFADEVVLQVKHGPMDFQVREPLSPVLAALPRTRLALELQVTQEYTGQQRHLCWLAPAWRELLGFPLDGERTVGEIVAGRGTDRPGGVAAVSNVGDDRFWTGHPLAQANLYAVGRLAWDPAARPEDLLDEWAALTFAAADPEQLARIVAALHAMMDDSWQRYEGYTAPLGVGFMVQPGTHGGPDVDGYEYSPWGTYHFADRDGIGVDRTRATGTGYTGQYPAPWRDVYESPDTCPDELLLFFHHVPYTHVLRSGRTVIQHVYDSRADAVAALDAVEQAWDALADLVGGPTDSTTSDLVGSTTGSPASDLVGGTTGSTTGDLVGGLVSGPIPADLDARVRQRLAAQRQGAVDWRDQVRSYFFRKSGVPDATGRRIY